MSEVTRGSGAGRAEVAAGAAVSLSGLRKHYGEVRAVDGVDLVIAPGEVVALLGPNGAGKSTTVDMLLGLTDPDSGRPGSSARHRTTRWPAARSARCCRRVRCWKTPRWARRSG